MNSTTMSFTVIDLTQMHYLITMYPANSCTFVLVSNLMIFISAALSLSFPNVYDGPDEYHVINIK